jgi:hypothetical protein
MDQGPLVTQQIDAGAKFINEFSRYTPVASAFWMKATDDMEWFLYVIGEKIGETVRDAYGEVGRIANQIHDPWLDSLHVRVMGVNKPVAKDVLKIQNQYPELLPLRYHGPPVGGRTIEEVYIYPVPTTVPA